MDALGGLCAGAALAALPRGSGPLALALGAALGALAVAWLSRGESAEPARAASALADWSERLAPWTALLFFVPVFTLAVAPGIDMAMHAALARALEDGARELSPAWPGVAPAVYPRGFSALMALLSLAGNARGSLIAGGIAFALYQSGAARLFAACGLRRPALLAALAALLSRTPQIWFTWGGLPNVLALGLGLRAAALALPRAGEPPAFDRSRALAAALLLAGAGAVHPTGALAAALALGAVTLLAFLRTRAMKTLASALGALAALAVIFALVAALGPSMSPRELTWMANYARTTEAIVRGPPALFFLNIWRALGPALGDRWTIACALACAWLGFAALRARDAARLQPLALPLLAVLGLGALLALAPLVPHLGLYFYPSRFAPLLALATAPLLDAALAGDQRYSVDSVHLYHAFPEASPAPRGHFSSPPEAQFAMVLLLACALATNLHSFQRAAPLASRDDLSALDCLAASVPPDAVIEGAYDDATEWIPALTGRRVTQPQKHCSLFDEGDAGLDKLHANYRYTGDGARAAKPFTAPEGSAPPICASGAARLWALPGR